jgi:ATP-dependent DNA helicase RecG
VLRDTNDGFVIAQKDLEMRGPGELLGTRQTGLADLRIAEADRHPEVVDPLIRRWLGLRDHYGKV